MDGAWSSWSRANQDNIGVERGYYGIYQIRVVNEHGIPIPIPRFGGVDDQGIIYLGKSGAPDARTDRSLATRIQEFISRSHSGGETYDLVRRSQPFQGHPLRDHHIHYSTKSLEAIREAYCQGPLQGQAHLANGLPEAFLIQDAELNALAAYFKRYSELPPCDSNFPRKWKGFDTRLQAVPCSSN